MTAFGSQTTHSVVDKICGNYVLHAYQISHVNSPAKTDESWLNIENIKHNNYKPYKTILELSTMKFWKKFKKKYLTYTQIKIFFSVNNTYHNYKKILYYQRSAITKILFTSSTPVINFLPDPMRP